MGGLPATNGPGGNVSRPDSNLLDRLAAQPEIALPPALALLFWRIISWSGHDLALDDAFISFRYARNLADGLGLVFNPGERVEGYTNFLWTVALALCRRLGADLPSAATVLAAAAVAATIILLWAIGQRLGPGGALAGAGAALLFAALGIEARYALSGMETPLFVALLTLALYIEVQAEGRAASPLATGAVLGLATLTRPEGVVYLGAFVVYELACAPGPWRERSRATARLLAGFALLFVPYFFWRYLYYGYLLPNTFYVKVDGPSRLLLARGAHLLVETVRQSSLELPAALALLGALGAGRQRIRFLFLGFVLASVLFYLAVGGDFTFFFGPRFLLPALPPLFLLAMAGIATLVRLIPAESGRVIVAGCLFLALLGNALLYSHPIRLAELRSVTLLNRCWTELGRWLARRTPRDATVAVGAIGLVPYYSERYTIDMLGLIDPHIAHLPIPLGRGIPGHEKSDNDYVLGRRPDYVVFARLDGNGRPFLVDWRAIKERFTAEYDLVAMVKAADSSAPWVIETGELSPELLRQGYRAAVYARRPAQ
jgi:arabinofuranosyltransferase